MNKQKTCGSQQSPQVNSFPRVRVNPIQCEKKKKKNGLFGIAAIGWIDTTSYIKPIEIA